MRSGASEETCSTIGMMHLLADRLADVDIGQLHDVIAVQRVGQPFDGHLDLHDLGRAQRGAQAIRRESRAEADGGAA